MRLPTPPEDSGEPHYPTRSTILEYQQMFKETVSAYKTRKPWNCSRIHERERVKMSYEEFKMLYEVLNSTESGQRYLVFRNLQRGDCMKEPTKFIF